MEEMSVIGAFVGGVNVYFFCYYSSMGSGRGKQRRARAITERYGEKVAPGTIVAMREEAFDDFVESQGVSNVRMVDYYSMVDSYAAVQLVGTRSALLIWSKAAAHELFHDLVSVGAIELGPQIDVEKFVFTVESHVGSGTLFVSYDGREKVLVMHMPANSFNGTIKMGELIWE